MTLLQQAIEDSTVLLRELVSLEEPLARAADMVRECLTSGHRVLVCGNGGSASDATHLATEFACRFTEDRRPYPALTLTSNGELLTAIGNDYAFDDVFARQVQAFGTKGDLLIVITTSGRSRNVVRALEEAKRLGLGSIGLLGRDGGFTRGIATLDLIVPGTATARIQEAHHLLLHVLCEMVEGHLPRE